STGVTLVWHRAAFAVRYDVYLGTSSNNMAKVGSVPAQLVNDPPETYSFKPSTPLLPGTKYFWRVESVTNAPLFARSTTRSFTTTGSSGPPPAPSNPSPSNGASNVGTTPSLTWAAGPAGTTYNVAFGTSNPPPQVATGVTTPSYLPGALNTNTTYYWRVTAVSSGGSTSGTVWSFTTGSVGPPPEVVLYASDISTRSGDWIEVPDGTAAGGTTLRHPDSGFAATAAARANPTHYFEATFTARANTRYRVWLRMRAAANSKWNDSVYVQFSDSVTSSGAPIYRIGTTSALTENLWTCATCQTTNWGW